MGNKLDEGDVFFTEDVPLKVIKEVLKELK